jgi:hypothetical protein
VCIKDLKSAQREACNRSRGLQTVAVAGYDTTVQDITVEVDNLRLRLAEARKALKWAKRQRRAVRSNGTTKRREIKRHYKALIAEEQDKCAKAAEVFAAIVAESPAPMIEDKPKKERKQRSDKGRKRIQLADDMAKLQTKSLHDAPQSTKSFSLVDNTEDEVLVKCRECKQLLPVSASVCPGCGCDELLFV